MRKALFQTTNFSIEVARWHNWRTYLKHLSEITSIIFSVRIQTPIICMISWFLPIVLVSLFTCQWRLYLITVKDGGLTTLNSPITSWLLQEDKPSMLQESWLIHIKIYFIIKQVMVMGLQLHRCIAKKVPAEKVKYFP